MRELSGRHLLLAGAAAAALHAAAAALILLMPAGKGAGGGGAGGSGSIEISLADFGGRTESAPPIQEAESPSEAGAGPVTPEAAEPDTPKLTEAWPAESEPQPETLSPPVMAQPAREVAEPVLAETPPDLIPVEAVEAVEAEPVKLAPADPVTVESPEIEPPEEHADIEPLDALLEPIEESAPEITETSDPAEEQQVQAVEMAETAPIPAPRPVRLEHPEPVQEQKPEPEPEHQPDPAPELAEKPAPAPSALAEMPELDNWLHAALRGEGDNPAAASPALGSTGTAAASAPAPTAGTGDGRAAGATGAPGASADQSDFRHEIAAWIGRHKRYPRRARAQGIEGKGVLRFAMDRAGNVLNAEVAQSSGSVELDRAILEMIRRAEPLPPIPAGLGDRLEFTVPVDFALR